MNLKLIVSVSAVLVYGRIHVGSHDRGVVVSNEVYALHFNKQELDSDHLQIPLASAVLRFACYCCVPAIFCVV